MEINLNDYEEVNTIDTYQALIGDIVYHPDTKQIQVIITEDTDLIQEEVYPMIENFGCTLLRPKSNC
jgi:hypothetical protein